MTIAFKLDYARILYVSIAYLPQSDMQCNIQTQVETTQSMVILHFLIPPYNIFVPPYERNPWFTLLSEPLHQVGQLQDQNHGMQSCMVSQQPPSPGGCCRG
jgi:hypothetical protein